VEVKYLTAAEACSTRENFQGPRYQQHPWFSQVTNNSRCS